MRKYTLNEDFFREIDSEEKAYWLGFIAADGCVYEPKTKRQKRLLIYLNSRDRNHIQKFLNAISCDKPIRDELKYDRSSVEISSTYICDSLIGLGVVPRKSLIMKPWNGDNDLLTHYWRGVVDGDGCITHTSNMQPRVDYFANHDMVFGFARFSSEFSTAKPRSNQGMWMYSVGCKPAIRLIERLYSNAAVALERKQHLAQLALLSTSSVKVVT